MGPEAGFTKKRNEARVAAKRSTAVVLASSTSRMGGARMATAADIAAMTGNGSGGGQVPPDVEIESPAAAQGPSSGGSTAPRETRGSPKGPMPVLGWLAIAAAVVGGAYVFMSGDGADDAYGYDAGYDDEEAA